MAIPASDPAKKIPQADLQPFANLLDVDQGEIPDTTFNAAVIRAVKPASFRSFFLANPLPFAHATDGATKADADVGWHGLPLSPGASHTTTADESHRQCSCLRNQHSTLQTLQIIMSIRMRGCSDFVT
jgi:hypothetical protein